MKLMTIGRTRLTMHPAVVLFALYMLLMGQGRLLALAGLSIALHEGAHALTFALLGYPPEEIEWTPLGALMRLEEEDRVPPLRRLLSLAAGPALTALLALLALLLTREGVMPRDAGRVLFMTNLSILAVNLLPVLPLDGGRITALALGLTLRGETVKRVMRVLGWIVGCLCVAGNLAVTLLEGGWNLTLATAGCFIIYAGSVSTASLALSELRAFMDRKIRLERRGCMDCAQVAVTADTPLRQAVKQLKPRRYTLFLLIEKGTMRAVGNATEDRLIAAYLRSGAETCAVLAESDEMSCFSPKSAD